LILTLHTQPAVPLEADVIAPQRLEGLTAAEVAAMALQYGNQRAQIGDFFQVEGAGDGEIRIVGDVSRVKRMGTGMTGGRILIEGDAGMHLGAGMAGGEIRVQGNVGDWLGAEMSGGRITVSGNAGHMVGSALRGSRSGVQGGEIIVLGNAGNEVGGGTRRGLIAIGGDCGDFAGVNMLAGTLVVLGHLGWRPGAGMRRGTIVSMHTADLLPTFGYACAYRPVALRLVLCHLRRRGLPVTDVQLNGRYRRWSGDGVELNKGEVLLLDHG
jgi:formylmethanofuran dehydrogenase subunit C